MNNKKWLVLVLIVAGAVVLIGISVSVQRWRQQKIATDYLKSLGISGDVAEEIARNAVNYDKTSGNPYETMREISISDAAGKAADAQLRDMLNNTFGGVRVTAYYTQNVLGAGMEMEYSVKNSIAADAAAKSIADGLQGKGFTVMSNASDAQDASIMVTKEGIIYNIGYSQEQQKVTVVIIQNPNQGTAPSANQ